MFGDTSIDWAATGTMLQGIGTIIGAVAVIVAAVIGGNTFAAWRRQQLVQRHMALAEQIMSAVFNAREAIAGVRSPFMTSYELDEAEKLLAANGHDLSKLPPARAQRLRTAQASLSRVTQANDVWKALGECRPPAYAYFGEEVPAAIDRILKEVHHIRVDASAYAEETGTDRDFEKQLKQTLSSSRPRGVPDMLNDEVAAAAESIESVLKPVLQEIATERQVALKAALEKSTSILSRLLPF